MTSISLFLSVGIPLTIDTLILLVLAQGLHVSKNESPAPYGELSLGEEQPDTVKLENRPPLVGRDRFVIDQLHIWESPQSLLLKVSFLVKITWGWYLPWMVVEKMKWKANTKYLEFFMTHSRWSVSVSSLPPVFLLLSPRSCRARQAGRLPREPRAGPLPLSWAPLPKSPVLTIPTALTGKRGVTEYIPGLSRGSQGWDKGGDRYFLGKVLRALYLYVYIY